MKADFYTEVYNIVREIPEGCVVTYGQLAKLARRPMFLHGRAGNVQRPERTEPALPPGGKQPRQISSPTGQNNGDYWRKKALPSRRMAALT